jgi:hypothetical protein
MIKPRLSVALLLGIVVGIAGCAGVKEDRMATALYEATNGYRQAIRWGYFDAAAGFLHPDDREGLDPSGLENIRVTGYEVIRPAIIAPDQSAVQLVRIEYVLEDEQRLRSVDDRQEWRWNADQRGWWLQSGLPAFTR